MVLKQDIRRTKVINQNLNPEWNEFFDYYVLGPIKFIFNLYDKVLHEDSIFFQDKVKSFSRILLFKMILSEDVNLILMIPGLIQVFIT